MVEEFKIYEATLGNFEQMRDRFLTEAAPRLAENGVSVLYAWEEMGETPRLIYLTQAVSEEALKRGWAAFGADPGWRSIKAASEAGGPLLAQQRSFRVRALSLQGTAKAGDQ